MAALRDIAEEVGVSVSLVSKVLNDRLGTTGVSADTLTGIRRVAERVGYRKNSSALALLAGRHNVIGVYIHCLGMAGSGIIEELLDGISTSAHQCRQRLQLNLFRTTEEFIDLCEGAHTGEMDGLVVGGVMHSDLTARLRGLRATGLPVVTVYDEPLHLSMPNVGLDQSKVARLATEHLIARGARAIAHIRNMKERWNGYRQALAGAGIPYVAARVFDASKLDFGHRVGEQAVQSFLDRGVAFDGIVAQSDQEAMGCINLLMSRGVRVPEKVRIIGIDNAPYCEFARIPLSSVSQNYHLRGTEAMRLMMDLIAGRKVRSTAVQPIVFARESSR